MSRSVSAFVTDAMYEMIETRRAKEGLNRSRYVHSLIVKGIAYELDRLAKYDKEKREWEVEEEK
jgi:HD superfamily phosphohydrolase YqeK